ncbi:hypothetical protein ACX93W_26955 [Paenibacillus sp. CAU 1782]
MRYLCVGLWIVLALLTGCANSTTDVIKPDESAQAGQSESATPSPETPAETEAPSNEPAENALALTEEEQVFVDRFYGVWTNTEQLDTTMEVQDGVILVGVKLGQLLTESKYVVTGVDLTEQSIVIEGTSLEISYDEENEERPLSSKIILQQDGSELLYIHDYLNEKIESTWTK